MASPLNLFHSLISLCADFSSFYLDATMARRFQKVVKWVIDRREVPSFNSAQYYCPQANKKGPFHCRDLSSELKGS